MNRWMQQVQVTGEGLSTGNAVSLFTDGDDAFRSIWADIDDARERVWLESYIYEPDRVGRTMLERLAAAARRGCDVILLYDGQGSPNMTESFVRPLREAGGQVIPFGTIYPWQRRLWHLTNPLHRDHRKTIVIDSDVAYVGGRNISEDYAGTELGTGRFTDASLRIQGPAAVDLARLFLQSAHEEVNLERTLDALPAGEADGGSLLVPGVDTARGQVALDRVLESALQEARQYCYITAAYFIAPRWLRKTLARISRQGVDVRILTAGTTDLPVERWAKRHAYGELLKNGVQIFEMHDRMLHDKHLVIDDEFTMIGSYNMDRWSRVHNLEVSIAVDDPELARRLRSTFVTRQERADQYTRAMWSRRPVSERLKEWFFYALMQL